MDKRVHLYVSRKNVLAWLMAACMVSSAVARIWIVGVKGIGGSVNVWSQIVLPVAACLLYAAIALLDGRERFFKTAIPVWLAGAYCALWANDNISSRFVVWLIWIAVAFFAFLYTELTSGRFRRGVWLLLPVELCPLAVMLYLYNAYLPEESAALVRMLPDILMLTGAIVLIFALKVHPAGEYHQTWGDRSDGRRLRTLPPMSQVSPYLMVTRNSSSNFFAESFEITGIDHYIRQKRREGMVNFGILHVILACYCRGVARFPGLNRFIGGQKVFSRGEDLQFCMTIKKEMRADSPDTVIKVHLSPRDTPADVYRKVNEAIEKVKNTPLDSGFDNTAHALTMIPGVFLKFTVWGLRTLDYFGLLPKFLLEVSPFHGSLFLTSMGSLGIPPIYHHLYDFGNLPVFGSFGCKRKALEVTEDGTVVQRKYVDFRFVLDERIVDGYYYAAFFKYFRRLMQHPESLDEAPEKVVADID